MLFGGHHCEAEAVVTEDKFTQQMITDLLPETVKRLTAPLYQHFDFFQPPQQFYEEEIDRMRKGQMF